MERRHYPRWQRRHEAILRMILEKPRLARAEIAAATRYSPWQVSRIINSPDFRARFEQMRAVINQELAHRYVERLTQEKER